MYGTTRRRTNRPKVITRCVADVHSSERERIVEFSDTETGLGGLISFRRTDAGGLVVEVYRCDPGVEVRFHRPETPAWGQRKPTEG